MTDDATGSLLVDESWRQLLDRRSFIEMNARDRADALVDPGSFDELAGPFTRLESPWLSPQGVTPQADDGVIVARGTLDGQPAVIASIEQGFQGGGTGEVSGAKIVEILRLAVTASHAGIPTAAVLLFETGGVRLQEANLGLNAVAEICSAILDLRPLAPVIGVIAGTVGCFGGMSIAAGLCTHLIVTPQARIGLNGPAVIEQEAGVAEFDSRDHAIIWEIDGGLGRHRDGLADTLVPDDAELVRNAVLRALQAGVLAARQHRSQRLDELAKRILRVTPERPSGITSASSRGRRWLHVLTANATPEEVIPSVLRVVSDEAVHLAVVPDPANPFHRARRGEVGLTESLALARAIREATIADTNRAHKRAIVAVVDLPSQAYGRLEEQAGLHQAMAAAVDAYHHARMANHPIVALVVGQALSGGFLTHGLQASQILALDDAHVQIHAMHKEAAARVTLRTVDQLDRLAATVLPLSYDVKDWAQLGFCDALIGVDDADAPTIADTARVTGEISAAIDRARTGPRDLTNRLDSSQAVRVRAASIAIREVLARQWQSRTRS